MSTIASALQVKGLDRSQLVALRKKARHSGTTPEKYVRKLIVNDLELDRLVATHSLTELSAPFREAFKETSEDEIGRLVEAVRSRHRRRLSKR